MAGHFYIGLTANARVYICGETYMNLMCYPCYPCISLGVRRHLRYRTIWRLIARVLPAGLEGGSARDFPSGVGNLIRDFDELIRVRPFKQRQIVSRLKIHTQSTHWVRKAAHLPPFRMQ